MYTHVLECEIKVWIYELFTLIRGRLLLDWQSWHLLGLFSVWSCSPFCLLPTRSRSKGRFVVPQPPSEVPYTWPFPHHSLHKSVSLFDWDKMASQWWACSCHGPSTQAESRWVPQLVGYGILFHSVLFPKCQWAKPTAVFENLPVSCVPRCGEVWFVVGDLQWLLEIEVDWMWQRLSKVFRPMCTASVYWQEHGIHLNTRKSTRKHLSWVQPFVPQLPPHHSVGWGTRLEWDWVTYCFVRWRTGKQFRDESRPRHLHSPLNNEVSHGNRHTCQYQRTLWDSHTRNTNWDTYPLQTQTIHKVKH